MKRIPISEQPFEDVATTTVSLGRQLRAMALRVHAGKTSRKVDFVARALQRIGERNAFDHRDDHSLEEVRRIIAADVEGETLGTETEFREVGYDADGPVIEVRNVEIFTERGEDLLSLLALLDHFVAARTATLDRAAAERAIRRLTSG
jgi:hypothetical protein